MNNRKAVEAPAPNLQRKDKFITFRADEEMQRDLKFLREKLEKEIGEPANNSDAIRYAILLATWEE